MTRTNGQSDVTVMSVIIYHKQNLTDRKQGREADTPPRCEVILLSNALTEKYLIQ